MTTLQDYQALRRQPDRWLPMVRDIAAAHGLAARPIAVLPGGTNLVVGLGSDLILKVFPPVLRHQSVSERLTLRHLHGRLSVATPELVVEGEWQGWPYLGMTRLPGDSGEAVWPGLAEADKQAVLAQVGRLVAEVQSLPVGPLAALEPAWDTFLPQQRRACLARHARLGLPRQLLDGLEAYLEAALASLPAAVTPVILTGEYIPENLLLTAVGGGVAIAGLIDFGDVMTGWREYDLLGPSTFMAAGQRGRVRALLRGYGYRDQDLGPTLAHRLLALMLLHRYSDLRRQVWVPGWQEAPSLEALAQRLWPW